MCQLELSCYRSLLQGEAHLQDHLAILCGLYIAGVLRTAWRLDFHGRVVKFVRYYRVGVEAHERDVSQKNIPAAVRGGGCESVGMGRGSRGPLYSRAS
jgi:hypothetical protein